MKKEKTILIIDDEEDILQTYRIALRRGGFRQLICCLSSDQALDELQHTSPDLILLDLTLKSGLSGREMLPIFQQEAPDAPVIIISGNQELNMVVDCMNAGAHDYLAKPIQEDRLRTTVQQALEWREVTYENQRLKNSLLRSKLNEPEAFAHIVTQDHHMLNLLCYAEIIAHTSAPVLITGESGTGKELFSRSIHNASEDADAPWMAVNVTTLDDAMFSDALFGHHRGAFTGADVVRRGLLEKTGVGTLLLDEMGDLNLQSQAKLLRLLQEKEYYPVGSDTPKKAHARIIATTNLNLEARMEAGLFRSDLYYRLNVHHIHIPPLRERIGDIPLLAEHFIHKAAGTLGMYPPPLNAEVGEVLKGLAFPGNARQLEALIFDAVIRYRDQEIPAAHFQSVKDVETTPSTPKPPQTSTFYNVSELQTLPSIKQVRLDLIAEAIRRSNGNLSAAARMIGITPQAMHKHIKATENKDAPST